METKIVPHKKWLCDLPYWKVLMKKTVLRIGNFRLYRWVCIADAERLNEAKWVEEKIHELENV